MIPVAAPPRVRQRLTAFEGPVPVLHAGAEAWYVGVDRWCVGVLGRHAARVPCGLRSHLPGSAIFGRDVAKKTGYLEHGTLWLGDRAFRLVRSVDVRAPRITVHHGFRTANSAAFQANPPALAAEFVRGIPGWVEGLDDAGMADLGPRLVGSGPGLTPLGDDLLCGWLATHRAASVATPRTDAVLATLLPATTPLSATLLDCAQHGEVLPEFGDWLGALGSPQERWLLDRLLRIGATSGAGLAEGARLALVSLTSHAKVAP